MNHFISLSEASQMTATFRQEKEQILIPELRNQDILTICETFDRAAFDSLLANPGCTHLRIYRGMKEDKTVHAIIVGVNADNEDILPQTTAASSATTTDDEDDTGIIDRGFRCPPYCPEESPLNS